jgi:hypothetical protein
MLRVKWPQVETEQEYLNRTGEQPKYCSLIRQLLLSNSSLPKCRKICLDELRKLAGCQDDSPEHQDLVIQYCRIIKKLSRDIEDSRSMTGKGIGEQ